MIGLVCDNCGRRFPAPPDANDFQDIVDAAAKEGWAPSNSSGDLCAECAAAELETEQNRIAAEQGYSVSASD